MFDNYLERLFECLYESDLTFDGVETADCAFDVDTGIMQGNGLVFLDARDLPIQYMNRRYDNYKTIPRNIGMIERCSRNQ